MTKKTKIDKLLLPELVKAQKKYGYLSEETLKKISKELKIPISRVFGVATFYSFLHTEKIGKNIIHVCNSPSCHVNGSWDIIKFFEDELEVVLGQTTHDKKFSLFESSCIGCCDEAPAMLLNGKPYTNLTKEKIKKILRKCKS